MTLTNKQLIKAIDQLNERYSLEYIARGLGTDKATLNREVLAFKRKLQESESIC